MNFEDLIAKVKTCGKQKLAVAAAEDDAVLELLTPPISRALPMPFWWVTRLPSARSRQS